MGLFGKNLKDWAKENNLQYEKKVKLSFVRSDNVALTDIIYGTYNGNPVFIFKVMDNSGNISNKHYYCNHKFYKTLKYDEISKILSGDLKGDMMYMVLGSETEVEIIQIIVAELYLNTKQKFEYDDVKKILKNLKKYYKSKVSFSDSITGALSGNERADIKYDDIEAIDFVSKNTNLDRSLIENVSKIYEQLLTRYNNSEQEFEKAYQEGKL
jgi:hypothetical protein